jgi:hypothetical protein
MGHHRANPRNQLRLTQPSIRKARIVGRIKAAHVRPLTHHFGKNGQAAQAGIEDENVRRF